MKSISKRSMTVAVLIMSGMAATQIRASTTQFVFSNPSGRGVGLTQTYTSGGLSITASGYGCGTPGHLVLCSGAVAQNTNYSTDPTEMFGNSDGLGMANDLIGGGSLASGGNGTGTSRYEIPNNEFIQLDFSTIFAGHTINSIKFVVTDIVTAWSLYDSKTPGVLKGSNGNTLVSNDGAGTTSFTINSPTSDLFSIIAGTNCDVVLGSITVDFSTNSVQAVPEPATLLLTGLTLVGLAGIIKKVRKKT